MSAIRSRHPADQAVLLWLVSICAMIVAMVVLGGITRLTRSGLSIVEWKPVMGLLPPLNSSDWNAAFGAYQRHPEYRLVNPGMTLAQFKRIYFWEYLHRVVGRLIFVTVAVPGVYLAIQRRLSTGIFRQALAGLGLIGAQGVLGWFMVKSGLVDRPSVSQYRLAAHLALALLTLAWFFWMLLDLRFPKSPCQGVARVGSFRILVRAVTLLIFAQICYGALTAGLKAGLAYNTFPRMNGEWIPSAAWAIRPFWLNFFENLVMVQFIHRTMAWSLFISVIGLWLYSRRLRLESRQRLGVNALAAAVTLQFGLGVATLLLVVPVAIAALHQLGACIVFLAAVHLIHAQDRCFRAWPLKR